MEESISHLIHLVKELGHLAKIFNKEMTELAKEKINNIEEYWNRSFSGIPNFLELKPTTKIDLTSKRLSLKEMGNLSSNGIKSNSFSISKVFVPHSLNLPHGVILQYYVLRKIISTKIFVKETTSELAYLLIHELVEQVEIQQMVVEQWKKDHRKRTSVDYPTITLDFFSYFKSLQELNLPIFRNKKVPEHFFHFFVDLSSQTGYRAEIIPYSLFPLEMADLKLPHIRSLKILCEYPVHSLTYISKKMSISRQTLSKHLFLLQRGYFLGHRVFFSPNAVGFNTYLLLFRGPSNLPLDVFQRMSGLYRLVRYKSLETLYLCQFHHPNSMEEQHKLFSWLKTISHCNSPRRFTEMQVYRTPVIGVEVEEHRYIKQNPELLDEESKSWKLGESSEVNLDRPPIQIEMDLKQRMMILNLLNYGDPTDNLRKHLKMKSNAFYDFKKKLEKTGILRKMRVIIPKQDLITGLFFVNGSLSTYREFLENVASKVPISLTYRYKLHNLDDSFEYTALKGSKEYKGVSFLTFPSMQLRYIIEEISAIDTEFKFAGIQTIRGATPIFEFTPTEKGWISNGFPEICFRRQHDSELI